MKRVLTRHGKINLWTTIITSLIYTILLSVVLILVPLTSEGIVGFIIIYILVISVTIAGIWLGNFGYNGWDKGISNFKDTYTEERKLKKITGNSKLS